MDTIDVPAGRWSSKGIHPGELTDAWEAALTRGYRAWVVPRRLAPDFVAQMRHQAISSLHLIECICGPCSGRRQGRQLRQDQEPYLGVQITRRGQEQFRVGERRLAIGAGDIVFWRSDQAMEFEVEQPLHKITLMLPWRLLEPHLPRHGAFAGARLSGRSGIGLILFSHIQSLAAQAAEVAALQAPGVQRATLELLAAAIAAAEGGAPARLSERYLRAVQQYILDHLHEPGLSLERIARANRISLRYLHRLFEGSGSSASAWIQQRRLERCREALRDPAFRHCSVASIAARWGFTDAAHFSRVFKAQVGQPPGGWRAGAARALQAAE